MNNRAALYTALGNLTVAEADYRKALELKRKIYGPDALTVGASLRNLAHLVSLRNRAEGEKLYREAVDLYAKDPKSPPFDYTSALLGLSEAQRNRGDLAAARATLQLASGVAAKGLGTKHPLYAAVLCDLGLVHQAAHEYPQAEQSLAASHRHRSRNRRARAIQTWHAIFCAWPLFTTKPAIIAPPNRCIAAAWRFPIAPWPTC